MLTTCSRTSALKDSAGPMPDTRICGTFSILDAMSENAASFVVFLFVSSLTIVRPAELTCSEGRDANLTLSPLSPSSSSSLSAVAVDVEDVRGTQRDGTLGESES